MARFKKGIAQDRIQKNSLSFSSTKKSWKTYFWERKVVAAHFFLAFKHFRIKIASVQGDFVFLEYIWRIMKLSAFRSICSTV